MLGFPTKNGIIILVVTIASWVGGSSKSSPTSGAPRYDVDVTFQANILASFGRSTEITCAALICQGKTGKPNWEETGNPPVISGVNFLAPMSGLWYRANPCIYFLPFIRGEHDVVDFFETSLLCLFHQNRQHHSDFSIKTPIWQHHSAPKMVISGESSTKWA